MNNFKVGDVVSTKDGSYSVIANKSSDYLGSRRNTDDKFTILAFGTFPTNNVNNHKFNDEIVVNDTIIQSEDGTVFFCHAEICLFKDNSVVINQVSNFACIAFTSSKYKGKALYLSSTYNWSLKTEDNQLFIVPTKKE